jgi:hypothetical protein
MLISYKNGQTGIILRVKIPNTSLSNNGGVTGLTSSTVGLQISTIADNESTAIVYAAAGSTIQGISTLGTYAAPSSGNCRFAQVDATNHPGVYEIQLLNTRYAVSGAKSLLITIAAITASSVAQVDVVIQLVADDPYVAKPSNFNLLNIDASGYVVLQTVGLDQITAWSGATTARQAIFYAAAACVGKISGLPTSPGTIKGLDGSTTTAVITFDANNNRTAVALTPP